MASARIEFNNHIEFMDFKKAQEIFVSAMQQQAESKESPLDWTYDRPGFGKETLLFLAAERCPSIPRTNKMSKEYQLYTQRSSAFKELVKELIKHKPQLLTMARIGDGATVLHMVVYSGNSEILEFILNELKRTIGEERLKTHLETRANQHFGNKIPQNKRLWRFTTPLLWAILKEHGGLEMARLLIKAGAEVDDYTLYMARVRGHEYYLDTYENAPQLGLDSWDTEENQKKNAPTPPPPPSFEETLNDFISKKGYAFELTKNKSPCSLVIKFNPNFLLLESKTKSEMEYEIKANLTTLVKSLKNQVQKLPYDFAFKIRVSWSDSSLTILPPHDYTVFPPELLALFSQLDTTKLNTSQDNWAKFFAATLQSSTPAVESAHEEKAEVRISCNIQ